MNQSERPGHEDLCEPMETANADEARLLVLYRRAAREDRTAFLFKLTRLHFAPFFAESFSRLQDARDPSYLHEELEQSLRLLCPRWHLGELDPLLVEPQFSSVWRSAWGDIAPVILGDSEQDGQRADELHRAVHRHLAAEGLSHIRFERAAALALIEDWREAVLQAVFSPEATESRATGR